MPDRVYCLVAHCRIHSLSTSALHYTLERLSFTAVDIALLFKTEGDIGANRGSCKFRDLTVTMMQQRSV